MTVLKQTNIIAFHTTLHSPKAMFLLDGKPVGKTYQSKNNQTTAYNPQLFEESNA